MSLSFYHKKRFKWKVFREEEESKEMFLETFRKLNTSIDGRKVVESAFWEPEGDQIRNKKSFIDYPC